MLIGNNFVNYLSADNGGGRKKISWREVVFPLKVANLNP
jgi:hypothetical protein